jgi:hypothetical protein
MGDGFGVRGVVAILVERVRRLGTYKVFVPW